MMVAPAFYMQSRTFRPLLRNRTFYITIMEQNLQWTPDESQQEVLGLTCGQHLVLAPPGCGKTQILAERIRKALGNGVKADDMLCLTFTNRAARGMRERVDLRVGKDKAEDVFVGNVHRFCSRFLFTNNIVPAETAIIDDDTMDSILAQYLNEDEEAVKRDFGKKRAHAQIMFFSHFMYDIINGVPRELRMHPECVTKEDMAAMKELAKAVGKPFDASLMADLYNHAEFYLDLVCQPVFPQHMRYQATQLLTKAKYAHAYAAYKRQRNLLDFEDLLQLTYHTLSNDPGCKRYAWIQVDEVQDLNPLQLAIINQLRASDGCFLYLGDEQQAIFSFMGAKLATLNALKEQCKGNVHHLGINHRQPRDIVEMLNAYAVANLRSDPALLPVPSDALVAGNSSLNICRSTNVLTEIDDVAELTKSLLAEDKTQTTAIVVNSNRDADEISECLRLLGVPHFKISGTDLFSTPEMKLLVAHLSVVSNELNSLAWAQILQGMKVCATAASARSFVHKLRTLAIAPTDLLDGKDEHDTYIKRFLHAYESDDIVVFDTETTGLNVFEDDVVQIAAERIRQGKVVDKFCIYLETQRPIPAMLGDIVNPIIEERKHNKLCPPAEGLRAFLDFANGSTLLAHNAAFDYNIMYFRLKDYLPDADWSVLHPLCFDSLKLMHLLRPDLKAFKLKSLLAELGLEGENSHLADDDVNATVSLVNYCYAKGQEITASQDAFLGKESVRQFADKLRRNYADIFYNTRSKLYARDVCDKPALTAALDSFYRYLVEEKIVRPVEKIDYVLRFLDNDVIDQAVEPALKEQLENHIMEISTFKEADICGSSSLDDRVFVSTIHKAKGLEFDNVIVFDAIDGRIPNFYSLNDPKALEEDARKLYVALSRVRQRLFVYYSGMSNSASYPHPQTVSRFMTPVKRFFNTK